MSVFLSRVDATISQGFLEIDLDKETQKPKNMYLVVCTGVKGASAAEGDKQRDLGNEEHVAFKFRYEMDGWDGVDKFVVPPEVAKILK